MIGKNDKSVSIKKGGSNIYCVILKFYHWDKIIFLWYSSIFKIIKYREKLIILQNKRSTSQNFTSIRGMQHCYFSNNSCLWKPCNISAQNFILYNKYVFLSCVVIVTTGSDGAKTFLPSVFHAQSGPHTQDFQQSCFVNSCYYPEEVISNGLGQRRRKESYIVLFSPPMARIELWDTILYWY